MHFKIVRDNIKILSKMPCQLPFLGNFTKHKISGCFLLPFMRISAGGALNLYFMSLVILLQEGIRWNENQGQPVSTPMCDSSWAALNCSLSFDMTVPFSYHGDRFLRTGLRGVTSLYSYPGTVLNIMVLDACEWWGFEECLCLIWWFCCFYFSSMEQTERILGQRLPSPTVQPKKKRTSVMSFFSKVWLRMSWTNVPSQQPLCNMCACLVCIRCAASSEVPCSEKGLMTVLLNG